MLTESRGLLDELRVVQLAQSRETRRHREVVWRERRAVAHGMLERVEDSVVHALRHQQRADRDVSTRQRLRDGDEVRLEAPVLESEQLPRASESGLHLVDREERPVAAAQLLRALQVAGWREVDTVALYWFDDEQRDVLASQPVLERVGVSERNMVETGQERAEPFGEVPVAVSGERAQRQPVKPVLRREDTCATRRAAAELERRFHRLGSRAREEDAREPRRRAAEQLFGQESRQQRDTELHRARGLELERLDERSADPRVVPPGVEHPEAAEQVEVPVAFAVEQVLTLRARPDAVEADRPQHLHELRVDRPGVELVVLARARLEELADHAVSLTTEPRGGGAPVVRI